MATRHRTSQDINAGSTADIAFLLLIFFLVTTTIAEDKGLLVKLPPYAPQSSPPAAIHERNIFTVMVNAQNQILAEGVLINIAQLKQEVKNFIINPENRVNLAEYPDKAIISLRNDRGTKYDIYLQVYNELKSAYNELWDEVAISRYGKSISQLSTTQIKSVKDDIPLFISEAEPTVFGEEN
jgi:biopolymer transport protein ExbD